jgi:hypothetical protein
LFDAIGRDIQQAAHVIGMCLLVWAILSAVQCIDRGDMFSGMFKAGMRGLLGAFLMKI